jgi:hypothetical protein
MTFETQTANQAGEAQLARVAEEFEQWRRQKTTRSERVPAALLREAQKLSQHYQAAEVRRRLGLSKSQWDKLDENKRKAETSEGAEFMRLVPDTQTSKSSELTIDVITAQGVKICLSGLSQQDPLALIAKLIEA